MHTRGWRYLACGLSLVLTACVPGAERPELALDVPASYDAARGRVDVALPALDWWRGFRSRELTLLMEEAQTANLDIAVAVARILQADAQARIAGAPLLPLVNFGASASRQRVPTAGANSVSDGGREFSTYQTSVNASYELDFWGKNRAALLAAEQNAVASRFDKEVVALTTLAAVATAYFQVLATQDRLRIARENTRAATRILNVIRERLSAGTASQLEVAQQESVVASQRAAIPPLEIALKQNMAALAVLVGRAPEHFAVAGGTLSRIAIPRVTPGLPSALLTQRPDIRAAEAALAAANYNVASARAAFFPSIQLTGETGFRSAALSALFGPGAWFYTVAASLTQPLFDGGRLQGQLELAHGQQLEALQTYRKSVISAFADVENALIALEQQTIRERLQAEVVRTAREAFEISERRLREGTVDLVVLIQTQQALFAAEDALVQIRLARLLALVSLYQALGGGWPPVALRPA